MMYLLLGVLAPIFLNLMHILVGIYVVVMRGNIMSLGFSAMSFLTKSIGILFIVWIGVAKTSMDWQIFVPLVTFFWFFTHIAEAFVIHHYMEKNVPKSLQKLQIQ